MKYSFFFPGLFYSFHQNIIFTGTSGNKTFVKFNIKCLWKRDDTMYL